MKKFILLLLIIFVATIGLASCEAEDPVQAESLSHGTKGDSKPKGDD